MLPVVGAPMRRRTRALYRAQVPSGRREVFVSSASGTDENDGSSPRRALASIQTALDRARPGDRIIVSGRAPDGPVSAERRHGCPDAWISIEAANGRVAPLVSAAGRSGRSGIDVQASSDLGIAGLEIAGLPH